MPTIMECADKLDALDCSTKQTALQQQRVAEELLKVTAKLTRNLRSWYLELIDRIPPPMPICMAPSTAEERDHIRVGEMHYARSGDNYLWILYWMFCLYLNLLIKQLQARHAQLAKSLATPLQLPAELVELRLDYEILDRYADNIRKSVFSRFQTSAFDAQETMAPVFTLQWYYEQRRNADKIRWCIDAMRTIEHRGLTLKFQVKETPSWCPRVRARFLADVE